LRHFTDSLHLKNDMSMYWVPALYQGDADDLLYTVPMISVRPA
jgi:hypothetical protein